MTQKKKQQPPTIKKTDQQPDLFQILRQEQGNNIYMRFYLQEDYYTFKKIKDPNQNTMQEEQDQEYQIRLPFNRIISQTVTDTLILNRFIYQNSRILSTMIDHGREMIEGHYIKKHYSWLSFLQIKQLKMLKQAYYSQSPSYQGVLEFSAINLSNLILKLGINISKLTCILIAKKNTTNLLSIPTLSVLFLQYLMYSMFQTKQIVEQLAKSQFLRQLPKITYIKFSEIINKEQLLLMQIGQQRFFTKHSFLPVKNIQYLQFYEKQEQIRSESYKRFTQYDYIRWINLSKRYGISSPYGFEILFLFRTIYFQIIKDFNPDVIIFVEDYDNTKSIIEPKIRGLLLNELMEQITGKVYVLRQVGFRTKEEEIFFGKHNNTQNLTKLGTNINKAEMIDQQDQVTEEENFQIQSTFPNVEQNIINCIHSMPLMNKDTQKKLDLQEEIKITQTFKQYEKLRQRVDISHQAQISKIKQILRDDLSYICLSLIQRSSFEDVYTQSHHYIYKQVFLQKVVKDLQNYWIGKYVIPFKTTNQKNIQLEKKLVISKNQVQAMIQNSKLPIIQLYKNYYDEIYDLKYNQKLALNTINFQTKEQSTIRYKDEDQVHVFYGQKFTLVFIFRYSSFLILKQRTQMVQFPNCFFEILLEETNFSADQISNNCTYIITDKFIYKGFGVGKINESLQGKGIYRLNYAQLLTSNLISENVQNKNKVKFKKQFNEKNWKNLTQITMEKGKDFIKMSLLNKTLGWGIYDKNAGNIIFMGGHTHNCLNENKINKFLHISNQIGNSIRVKGKTSYQIFLGTKNPKLRIPLYPFIYGIPFVQGKTCFILNTNGMMQSFSNSNKLFLTQFKLSQNLQQIRQSYGIISQRKMFVDYQDEDERIYAVTAKQHLVYYIVNSYNLIDRYENRCVLQTLEQGALLLQLCLEDQYKGKKLIGLKVKTDRPQYNGFDQLKIYFNAIEGG